MEFKVIFTGFALHCVLNAVLICKSVVTKGEEDKAEQIVQQQEQEMINDMSQGDGVLKRVRIEGSMSNF